MDKNKSIDGLSPRRTKKIPKKIPSSNTRTLLLTQKPVKKAIKRSHINRPSPSPSQIFTPTHKATPEPTIKPTSTSEIIEKIDVVEDFLQPVQAFDLDLESDTMTPAKKSPKHQKFQNQNRLTLDKPKKKVSKKRKIITSIILGIILLLIAGIVWLILWGNDIIAKITGGQGNVFDLFTFMEETYEPLKTDKNGRTNILAFGTSGYNMEGDVGNGVHDGATLTDSIMIISLNQESGDIAVLSLPRDLKVSSTCTATSKINEVYWCNNMNGDNEQAGATALMEAVGNILNIDFQYYAHINWGSLIQIVDTLGGIKVTLDEDVLDYYGTGYNYYAGTEYDIDGFQAMVLSRARYGTRGGDFSRSASQQKIFIGIKDKILEKHFSIPELISLASTLGDNLRTNFSVEEIKTIAHLASTMDFVNIRQIALVDYDQNIYYLTTGHINGISYVIPSAGVGNYSDIKDYLALMLSNDPRTYEDATILILNATETPGLAAAEQENLDADGFVNISIDDAPLGEYQDDYLVFSSSNDKPGTQKLLEEKYNTTTKPFEELAEDLRSPYDFIIIVNTSSES